MVLILRIITLLKFVYIPFKVFIDLTVEKKKKTQITRDFESKHQERCSMIIKWFCKFKYIWKKMRNIQSVIREYNLG